MPPANLELGYLGSEGPQGAGQKPLRVLRLPSAPLPDQEKSWNLLWSAPTPQLSSKEAG